MDEQNLKRNKTEKLKFFQKYQKVPKIVMKGPKNDFRSPPDMAILSNYSRKLPKTRLTAPKVIKKILSSERERRFK